MSIDRINRQTYINAYNSNYNKNVNKVTKTKDVDTIEISELAKSLKNYASDNTTVNVQKVAEIKNKIENGTYKVDARLTAESILNAIKEQDK